MGRRTLLLIAALVVAALGTVLIFAYVRSADQRAEDEAQQVEVLVATQEVAAGTTAAEASNEGAFELDTIDAGDAPQGALTDISIISDQVALAPVFPGQVILAQMFGSASATSGLSVPKDKIAISVSLGDPERVAGFVVPGSEVAVFATLQDANDSDNEITAALLPKVEVIGVGATTLSTQTTTTDEGESTTEEIPLAILTLALDQREAQKVINAQSGGALYFGLLGDNADVRTGAATQTRTVFLR